MKVWLEEVCGLPVTFVPTVKIVGILSGRSCK